MNCDFGAVCTYYRMRRRSRDLILNVLNTGFPGPDRSSAHFVNSTVQQDNLKWVEACLFIVIVGSRMDAGYSHQPWSDTAATRCRVEYVYFLSYLSYHRLQPCSPKH